MEQGITLYNTAIGGRRGHSGLKRSKETCDKISKARKGKPVPALQGKKHTEEAKQRMSKSAMGKPGTNKGKKFSDEWKENMSEAQKANQN